MFRVIHKYGLTDDPFIRLFNYAPQGGTISYDKRHLQYLNKPYQNFIILCLCLF
jgi:hypothetical protein